jgi:hypothetical protein
LPAPPRYVLAADLDGNSAPDLVFPSLSYNQIALARNRGDGSFLPAVALDVGGRHSAIAVGDVNGDSMLDLVVGLYENDAAVLLLLNSSLPSPVADCNRNGIPDACDLASGKSTDCDHNGIPDDCQSGLTDCDRHGVPDICEIESGAGDCNQNGIPDSCEIASGAATDCNQDGIPDSCQLADRDCNQNGILDTCDIAAGRSADCNRNGVPDECDVASGSSQDLGNDGIPDECQGGFQVPGDANEDKTVDLSDALWHLGHLFLGLHPRLPCEGGSASQPGRGELSLLDWNGDGALDLSDPVGLLGWLFLAGHPHFLGPQCQRIVGSPETCQP